MLIIFDLDDTLVDTSGSIIPRKMEEVLIAMIEAGLVVDDFASALTTLQALNASAESSPSAIAAFLSLCGYSQDFLPIGLAKLREELSAHHGPVLVVPHALDMLKIVKKRHSLSIVTIGEPLLQFSKLKKAGIDPSIFSKIDIIEGNNKKPSYQAIIDEADRSPQEVVVCGDRVAIDLTPAKELHCHTVHLARGRGKYMRESALSSGVADYAIEDWGDFVALIERLEERITLGRS